MSKLDTILDEIDLHSREVTKLDIKILFLELYKDALAEETILDLGNKFRALVESL